MIAALTGEILVTAVPPFFLQVVALVAGAAVIAFISHRLGLVPIVGFLVAGIVIGPFGLGWVRDQGLVDAVAEIGVVLLLFTIGIEFSLEKLARIQRLIFGGGGLQVALATLATTLVLLPFGVDWRAAVFTGFLVSLSSTAIVLKLLANRGETDSAHGQVGLGLLIFQDLAVIVMVLLMPILAGHGAGSPSTIVWALAKAGAIIALVLVLARRFMPPLIEAVARTCSPEIFLLTVVAVCLGTALLTSLAGVSLSLGAFLAGLLVSESRFSEYALGEILPLQVLFSAAFFVSVGMLLDLGFLMMHLPAVLAVIAAVLAIKVATTLGAVRALRYPLPVAAAAGLMLAQVGEFSFVLERSGRELGLTPAGLGAAGSQTFIAATVVLMVLTPFLTGVGGAWAGKLERRRAALGPDVAPEPEALPETVAVLDDHVIVSGYGEAARRLTRVLHGSGIPFLVVTLSPGGANEAEADGMIVLRGDSTRQRTLQMAGIERARMVVIPDDDPAATHRIAMLARSLNGGVRTVVRTRFLSDIESLQKDGVDRVVAEELESIVTLFTHVLRDYQIPAEQIEQHEEAVRRGGYAALRAEKAPEEPIAPCDFGDCPPGVAPSQRGGGTGSDSRARPAGSSGAAVPAAGARTGWSGATAVAEPIRGIDTEQTVRFVPKVGPETCTHLDQIHPVRPSSRGCEDCLRIGDTWVHLRICLTCGHMGCCDSSRNRHARAHWRAAGHPMMRSMEPGETWGWCFEDEAELG